jgi:uncharacterized linocin/CFP29 family protein
MIDSDSGVSWSAEQWNTVRRTVHDEALRARVAASFLPLFGPLDSDVQAVPRNLLKVGANGLEVEDYDTMRLVTVSVNVQLRNAQMADPDLTSALIMFRRAAEIVARVEDAIIFNGQSGVDKGPRSGIASKATIDVCKVSGGEASPGLLGAGSGKVIPIQEPTAQHDLGPQVYNAVVAAIQSIESRGYFGPFACVMGDTLFTAINTPIPNSMVLPREGIIPFLDAPLLRSSTIPPEQAVLVSLRGAPVEIVVPSDISVRYLTTTPESKHVFRVQQKFVLRVKEPEAIGVLRLDLNL